MTTPLPLSTHVGTKNEYRHTYDYCRSGTCLHGISREHKFHFMDIPNGWIKVDVWEALAPNVQLMMENQDVE
jgi:hypothetical protein